MKIVRLQAENVKRLVAVEIEPDGNVVVIAGANAQGKSSVLDAIWMGLGGGPAQKGTSRPIRDGESHAKVTLDLGDIIITRTWEGDKTSLKVTSSQYAVFKSPQTMLDGLLGALTFDPLAFTQQAPKEQVATLLGLVELPFDPAELDGKRQGLYDQRTEIGRSVKALEGKLQGVYVPVSEPGREVSASDAVEAYSAAQAQHAAYDQAWARRAIQRDKVTACEQELARARERLAEIEADLASLEDLPDLDALKAQVDTVEESNATLRRNRETWDLHEQYKVAKVEQQALTAEIEGLDKHKADSLAAAAMPIKGLAFDEEGVTYNGVPFSQASSAEQLRVSLAMAIATNPTIRVARITDGSLLDKASMAVIAEMAEEHDFQVFIEVVDESGEVGIVIEDGTVARVNG
jgi:hypothetical protein